MSALPIYQETVDIQAECDDRSAAVRRAFNGQMAQLEKWIEIMAALTIFATTLLLYAICGRAGAAVSAVALVVVIVNMPNRFRQIAVRRRMK
jgi:hypothetical protein